MKIIESIKTHGTLLLSLVSIILLMLVLLVQILILTRINTSTYSNEGVINAIDKIREFKNIELDHDCNYSVSGYEWLFKK